MITDHRFIYNFEKYRYLLIQLIKRDIQVKYRNSVLGIFWSFLEPLLSMLIMTIIFSYIFKRAIPNFPVYYLIGRVCFTLLQTGSVGSQMSIVGSASILKTVYIPKYLYALASVLSSFVTFLLSLIILFSVMVATHVTFTIYIIFGSIPIILLVMFTLGIGLILATATVFFRDLQHLYAVFVMLWMYATPIFYPASIVPEKYNFILTLNPMYAIIDCLRTVFMDGTLYNPSELYFAAASATFALALGMGIFYKYQDKFLLHL